MLGATEAQAECPFEGGVVSTGTSVKCGFVFLIAASRESNHAPKLLFDQAFIPQF